MFAFRTMPSIRPIYYVIHLAVSCLILAIGLRTWLVMGLIEPVTVAGSSMAPTLRGSYVTAQCPHCRHDFSVGAEFAVTTASVPCPQCENLDVPLDSLDLQRGDRLWVDRASLLWRQPQRWELVVAHNPENASELCIKRIVGLPGERVRLRNGNVLVSNAAALQSAVVIKSFDERHDLRQKIHREHARSQRWKPADETQWQLNEGVWLRNTGLQKATKHNGTEWLRYQHPHGQPITDDVTYNAGLTRKLNLVNEFMLSVEVKVQGEGSLRLSIHDGTTTAQIGLYLPDGKITTLESNRRGPTVQLSERSLGRLLRESIQIEFSNFDQQLLLVIDGNVELRRPWPTTKAAGTDRPVSIGANGLEVRLGELTLFRDIYHSTHAVATPPPQSTRWQLGENEYFLLGDNGPVSVDSRLWGPVSGRYLLGKPLFRDR